MEVLRQYGNKAALNLLLFGFLVGSVDSVFADDTEREDTPVYLQTIQDPYNWKKSRDWAPPDYANQKGRLSYDPADFSVNGPFKDRVAFWKDIFVIYSNNKALLHDSKYLNIVYEIVDFSKIDKKYNYPSIENEEARKDLIEERKKKVRERLSKLEKIKDSKNLKGEDLRIWNIFLNVNERDKFKVASEKGRLRLQLGQREHFKKAIYMSGRYLPYIESVFKKHKIPMELTRLPFVESSFNIFAESKFGAAGMWQFMRGTARRLMKINHFVDERYDPYISTEAAAKVLRQNYKILGRWPLAITGYNRGPYGVRRLVRKYKTKDLATIIDRVEWGNFAFASSNFYASFLAVLEIEKNADKYFKDLKLAMPLKLHSLKVKKRIDVNFITQFFDSDLLKARFLNSHVNPSFWTGKMNLPKYTRVVVPLEKRDQFVKSISKYTPPKIKEVTYRVKRGESLSAISEKFGIGMSELIRRNGIRRPNSIRIGQKIKIPKP